MFLFLTALWMPTFIAKKTITINRVFVLHLINSILALIFFTKFIHKFYKKLPNKNKSTKGIIKRIIKTRWFSYSTHITKNFFNGNFLTPFFAANFGLIEAGIFNIANQLAESLKALTKATVIFSGGGLFSKFKQAPLKIKKRAFKILCKNLNKIIYPIIIFITINYKFIFKFSEQNITSFATTMALLFFIITGTEFFFMAYEQFYIVEESVAKLFIFKLMELILFYSVINSKFLTNPILILLGLVIVKLISFSILAINAYSKWKLKPYFKINKAVIFLSILISIIFSLLIKL
ncbi:hypothetical protein GF385_02055 [Candidatus Dependentiae bacterium]|nr:hypothetical protein [Candidatus Dependentiae bacterium]